MHFFCDLTSLATESEAFGPILHDNGSDPVDKTKTFNVGAKFTMASATKAFACETGMMIVHQSDDASLVNVIIKPIPRSGGSILYGRPKYYLYRGLLKSDFISGSNVLPDNPTVNSELINRFWEHRNDMDPVPATLPTAQVLGYDTTLSNSLNVESIFNNQQPGVRAILVKEGEWIGNFAPTTGSKLAVFEIIMDTDSFNHEYTSGTNTLTKKGLDLEYLAYENYYIDVNGIPEATDADKFKMRVRREEVTSYVDPAAFFGMHNFIGVNTSTYSGGTKTTVEKVEPSLYTDVLVKFLNKNRVYVDVRNENGYSYDFYLNYDDANDGNIFQFGLDATSPNIVSYLQHEWPIFYYDTTAVGNTNFSYLGVQLKLADNANPLLFIQDSSVRVTRKDDSMFEDNLIPDPIDPFTNTVSFKPPIHTTGANENIAYVIKLHYLRQDAVPGTSATVPKVDSYLDSVFADIDLAYEDGSISVFQESNASKLNQVNQGDFSLVAKSRVYETATLVTCLTERYHGYRESETDYPKIEGGIVTNAKDVSAAQSFPQNIVFNRSLLTFGATEVKVVDVPMYNSGGTATKKEELFMLFISKAELDQLRNLANTTGLSEFHKRTIVFKNRTTGTDDFSFPYTKYELHVQGVKSSDATVVTSSASGIFVYTFGDTVFTSKDGGNLVSVPLALPDASTLSKHDNIGTLNYNDTNIDPLIHSGFVNAYYEGNTKQVAAIRGRCYFPSDSAGQILPGAFPLVVIVHGNGQHYFDYVRLAKHLAKNGFIASTISCLVQGRTEYTLTPATLGIVPTVDYTFAGIYYDSTNNALYYENGDYFYSVGTKTFIPGTPAKIKFGVKSWRHGMEARGRVQLLVEHIKVLKGHFTASMENNLGIMGHSRGGEAVIRAAKEILTAGSNAYNELDAIDMNNLNALIALAPSDQYPAETYSGGTLINEVFETLDKDVPFFTVYGTRDHDISGGFITFDEDDAYNADVYLNNRLYPRTSISLYDRADVTEKAMIYVREATHNGFITTNKADIRAAERSGVTVGKLAPYSDQRKVSEAYMNAFFRMHLLGESFWKPYFSGEFQPPSTSKLHIHNSYSNKTNQVVIDDMQSPNDWFTSSRGEAVTLNGLQSQTGGHINKRSLRILDGDKHVTIKSEGTSPHRIKGIRMYAKANDVLVFPVPTSDKDVSTLGYLSFRITYSFRYKDLSGMKIALKDGSGTLKAISIDTIKRPDVRTDKIVQNTYSDGVTPLPWKDNEDPTKPTLETIRIALLDYQFLGIDLTDVTDIQFLFPDKSAGKVVMSEILFTD